MTNQLEQIPETHTRAYWRAVMDETRDAVKYLYFYFADNPCETREEAIEQRKRYKEAWQHLFNFQGRYVRGTDWEG